jgi:hypothetical protein
MAAGPKHHRNFSAAIPRLPLPAILAFTVAGLGGSIFLTYTSFSHTEAHYSAANAQDVPVYSARAVPFDEAREDATHRAAAVARALTATQSEMRSGKIADAEWKAEAEAANSTLLAENSRELRGFNGFSNFGAANSYLAVTGTNFGISAQMAPSGFVAPDAETVTAAAVPESSTWLCGAGLLALVAGRGIRASRVRSRRRSGR